MMHAETLCGELKLILCFVGTVEVLITGILYIHHALWPQAFIFKVLDNIDKLALQRQNLINELNGF